MKHFWSSVLRSRSLQSAAQLTALGSAAIRQHQDLRRSERVRRSLANGETNVRLSGAVRYRSSV